MKWNRGEKHLFWGLLVVGSQLPLFTNFLEQASYPLCLISEDKNGSHIIGMVEGLESHCTESIWREHTVHISLHGRG
jgi:hypothetical protein